MPQLAGDRSRLEAFRRGEPAALEWVYRAYSAEVVRYLAGGLAVRSGAQPQRVLLSPSALEAAHQETFVRAFRPNARLAYDGLRPYRGFLFAIARTAAIDLFRAQGKVAQSSVPLEPLVESGELETLGDAAPSPEETALNDELHHLTHAFLESLPEPSRQLAQRRFLDGESQESAAAALGLTRSELRTREKRLTFGLMDHLRRAGWLGERS